MARVRLDIEDPANRMTLRALLLAEGHEVVRDGAEVLFTDMPAETVANAREFPRILLARASDIPKATDAMREGAFGYILVPFQPGEAGIMIKRALEWRDAARPAHDRNAASRPTGESPSDVDPAPMRIEDAEARVILATMRRCKNNQTEAARLLGIGRNTLWRKLKRIRARESQP